MKPRRILCRTIVIFFVGMFTAISPWAQQAIGPVGARTVKAYWIENGSFLAITGSSAWDNPVGCTNSDLIIVAATQAGYKQILATVMLAMSSGLPLTGYAQGCFSVWGNSYPSVYAVGVRIP